MGLSIKHTLDRRHQKKDKTYPLVLQIVFKRKTIIIPTGYSFLEVEWDSKNQSLKSKSTTIENITRFNNRLIKKRSNIFSRISDLDDRGILHTIPPRQLKNYITDNNEILEKDLFSFIAELHNELVKANKIGLADTYKMVSNKVKKFVNRDVLSFKEIDYQFLSKFEKEHLVNGNKLSSLSVYLRALRAIYNKAIQYGYADKEDYPFKAYKIRSSKPQRAAMELDDFQKLIKVDLSNRPYLDQSRAYYLISFYLRGMNWMDMCNLKIENFNSKTQRIHYIRQKTGKPFNIKVPKDIFHYFSIVSANLEGERDTYIFNIKDSDRSGIYNAERIKNKRKRLNKNLRTIAEKLNIEPFTIYTARHTYATLQQRFGTPAAYIQQQMGHETEAQTQEYLKGFGDEVLDRLDEDMFNKI
ncbi:MAG: phage integrase SAM-like domain-containing protein [Bacteroidota bacterium]